MRTNKLWDEKMAGKDLKGTENKFTFSLEQLEQLFSIKIKNIYGCLGLVFGEEDEALDFSEQTLSRAAFKESVKKGFGSEIGYEYSGTELRIIDYVDQALTVEEQYLLGRIYIQCMNNRLALMTDRKIHYVMGFDEDILTTWFYQDWENVLGHFDELEGFINPVAVLSSEEVSSTYSKVE